jgi:hypothetical protein
VISFIAISCSGDRNIDEDERYNRSIDSLLADQNDSDYCYSDTYKALKFLPMPRVIFSPITPKELFKEQSVNIRLGGVCFYNDAENTECDYYCSSEYYSDNINKTISLKNIEEVLFEKEGYQFKYKVECTSSDENGCSEYSFRGSVHETLRDIEVSIKEVLHKIGDFTYQMYAFNENEADVLNGEIWKFKTQEDIFFLSRSALYSFYGDIEDEEITNNSMQGYFHLDLPNSLLGKEKVTVASKINSSRSSTFNSFKLINNKDVYIWNRSAINYYNQELFTLNIKFRFNLYE